MSDGGVLMAAALIVCRAALGLVFALSCWSKARDMATFAQAVARFQLIGSRWAGPAAALVVLAEAAVALTLALGGRWLVVGFALALSLLLVFSAALLIVLRRGLAVSCNCFGRASRPIAPVDLGRNTVLGTLSGAGLLLVATANPALPGLPADAAGLLILIAAALVAVTLHLPDLAQLYRSSFEHTS